MYGAVIGDIVGSVYEWNNIRTKEFPLFSEKGAYTDDTILTIAVADWLMNGGAPEDAMRRWGNKYTGETALGKGWFGPGFKAWLADENMGPYQANTNGAVMRISAVPFLIRDTKQAFEKADEVTNITHNHPESIKAVHAYIEVLHKVFAGEDCGEIKKYIENEYGYNLSRPVEDLKYKKFNYTCKETVPEAMICALDAVSFEDTLRNAVSLGGDSDTLACMAGAIAEARFGIPKEIGNEAKKYIDKDVYNILKDEYSYQPVYTNSNTLTFQKKNKNGR